MTNVLFHTSGVWNSPNGIQVVGLSSSAVANMMPSHKLFPRVDWDKVEAGNYAVVDPVNPGHILYLAEQDYVIMVRVSLTTNRTLKVLAQPGDTPPTTSVPNPDHDSSQNSPLKYQGHPWLSALIPRKGNARKARKQVKYLFHSPFANPHWREKGDEESMIKIHGGNLMDWLRIWYNKCHFLVRGSLPTTVHVHERNAFGHRLRRLIVTQGLTQVIMILKLSVFVVNSYLGGQRLLDTSAHGFRIRLSNGLPHMLPLYVRSAIRGHNLMVIRLWLTILNSYKGFKGKWGLPPLGSITSPHPILSESPYYITLLRFVSEFWVELRRMGVNLKPDFTIKNLFWTSKAGPNHPNSVLGSGLDAYAWSRSPHNLIKEWLTATGQSSILLEFRKISKMVPLLASLGDGAILAAKPVFRRNGTIKKWVHTDLKNLVLGRLHALYEPAGKVRVVAIVDYWTQAVLKPVHDWMFSILRLIPTDATFDQEGALRTFVKEQKASGNTVMYSLDLKSATDTIPLGLYRVLFEEIFGSTLVELWLRLLTDRNFLLPKEVRPANGYDERRKPCRYTFDGSRLQAILIYGLHKGLLVDLRKDEFVRYTCGQPMGALSSWSSMALVHHFLVQYSASLVRGTFTWFGDYRVLGDDVVIANKQVAMAYQSVLASFSINVGLVKSYISEIGMFNFANQTFLVEDNISPLSLREEVGIDSLPARAEMAMRALRRGWFSMTGANWLSRLLHQFVTPQIYREIIADLRRGVNHPIVSWITSVLFLPGSTRFREAGVREVSINTFLASLTRRVSLWNEPIVTLNSKVSDRTLQALALSILQKSADRLYKEFLGSRVKLRDFQTWLIGQTSVSVEYVLKRVFEEQRQTAFDDWAKDYRVFVKTLQVLGRVVGGSDVFLWEHTLNMPLDEIFKILSEAEATIPRIPDFSKADVSALTASTATSEEALDRFLKVAKLLGTIDGAHDGNVRTTGGKEGPSRPFGNEGIPSTKPRPHES